MLLLRSGRSCKWEIVLKLKVRRINNGRKYEPAFRDREWVLFTHSIRFFSPRARFEWSSCHNIRVAIISSQSLLGNVFLSGPSELYRAFIWFHYAILFHCLYILLLFLLVCGWICSLNYFSKFLYIPISFLALRGIDSACIGFTIYCYSWKRLCDFIIMASKQRLFIYYRGVARISFRGRGNAPAT